MTNYSNKNIEFARQSLFKKIGRPPAVLSLLPLNSANTTLSIQIIDNATAIGIRYTAGSTTTESVSFVGKSLNKVAQEINALSLPIKATALADVQSLSQGDLISLGSQYVSIPTGFSIYDRYGQQVLIRSNKFFVKHKSISNIKLLTPYYEDSALPWYPRITNGSFTNVYDGKIYHYYIPEYNNQTWSPIYGKPFKTLFGIKPLQVDVGVYRLPRFPVYWDGANILVYNGDVPLAPSSIEDIDTKNGYLYLNKSINIVQDIRVDYTYFETSYVYPYINLNGHFNQNPLLLNKYVVIYIIPVEGASPATKRTIFHSIGDSIEDAISSIVPRDRNIPYTVLGAYSVQQVYSSDKVQILDTRVLGGGLKLANSPISPVHYIEKALNQNLPEIEDSLPHTIGHWDIATYDGEAYPGSAAVLVDLPSSIKDNFDITEIHNKTSKFIAAGVYPHISFSERELPAITGLSTSVSCTFNSDFTKVLYHSNTGGLYTTLPTSSKGFGWIKHKLHNTTSYISGSDSEFNYALQITGNSVITDVPIKQFYLKSSPIAGFSWKEREVVFTGNYNNSLSTWKQMYAYDSRTVNSGELIKGDFVLDPNGSIKEYKDINIHVPFHFTGNLQTTVEDNIHRILDKRTGIYDNFNSTSKYTDIIDLTLEQDSDYFFSPNFNEAIISYALSDVSGEYHSFTTGLIHNLLTNGIETSGLFLKYYVQSSYDYVNTVTSTDYFFSIKNKLDILHQALRYKKVIGEQDSLYTKGITASNGILSGIVSCIHTGLESVPYNYMWNSSTNQFTGVSIPTAAELTGTITDISFAYNKDYQYLDSMPAIFSVLNTHRDISNYIKSGIENTYTVAKNTIIDNIDVLLNSNRTYNGQNIVTESWCFDQGRYSTFLGNVLKNLVKSIKYLQTSCIDNSLNYSTTDLAGLDLLHRMFIGIETILECAYVPFYNMVTKSSIFTSDVANVIEAYAWYVNNWEQIYGLTSVLYNNDYRIKYKDLAISCAYSLLKSHFSDLGDIYETTFIAQEPGPFALTTPTKIYNSLVEVRKLDPSIFNNIILGFVNTINRLYEEDGLYYNDPLKRTNVPGPETEIVKSLIKINSSFNDVTLSGYAAISTGLDYMYGTNYIPVYDSYTGQVNTLVMWKYFNSGNISSELDIIKEQGINTVKFQLDYHVWKEDPSTFYNNVDTFLSIAKEKKLRLIPTILKDDGLPVSSSSLYYTGLNYLSGNYSTYLHKNKEFLDSYSGLQYVSGVISRYDSCPCIIAWDISNNTQADEVSLCVINRCAKEAQELSRLPIMVTLDIHNSKYNINQNSEYWVEIDPGATEIEISEYGTPLKDSIYIDILALNTNNTFSKYIDIATGFVGNNKPIVLNNLGEATYGSYNIAAHRATSRDIPFILSNILITEAYGEATGYMYTDSKTRSEEQQRYILNITSGSADITQELSFEDKLFYNSGYEPAYTSSNLINDIYTWSYRPDTTIAKERHKLSAVHDFLDIYNYILYPNNYIPELLSTQDCYNLIYFRSESLIQNSTTFNTSWGNALATICRKLNING